MKLAGYLHEIDKAQAADSGVNAATERYTTAARELAEVTRVQIANALQGSGGFLDSELVYAASFRCSCGAGMAYPDGIDLRGAWYCSAILKGEADRQVEHIPPQSFALYSVKSETESSAYGHTTRPDDSRVEISPWYVCRKCCHSGIGESYKPGEKKDIEACEECGASRYRDGSSSILSDNLIVRYLSTAYLGKTPPEETPNVLV